MNNPKKILIIERYAPLRDTLVELLLFYEYEVHSTDNGNSGLELARSKSPDLIICSRRFSDVNCWFVLQSLKKEESTKQIPIVFLSSKPAGEEHERMIENRSVTVLIKPFSIKSLLDTIYNRLFFLM